MRVHTNLVRTLALWVLAGILLAGTGTVAVSAAPGPQADALAKEAAEIKVLVFQSLCDPEKIKALKAETGISDAGIEALRKLKAVEISNDYYARQLLKTGEFENLGKKYFQTWFGDGDGLIHEVISRAKGKMSGIPDGVLDRIRLIQRQESREAMKAPMDFDIGILSDSSDETRALLKELGGPAGVQRFQEELEEALNQSYMEIYKEMGGSEALIPERAFITATTAWHPEAYLDGAVLRKGVPGKDLIQQTIDVSKYKVSHMREFAEKGFLSLDEAMTEAARGTMKDLAQVERVFAHIGKITGIAPEWRTTQGELIGILRKVSDGAIDVSQADAEIRRLTGNRLDLFGACENLVEQMESAWKLRVVTPRERFLSLLSSFLKNDDDYARAVRALLAGRSEDLPAEARRLVTELENIAKMRMVSVRGGTAAEFLKDVAEKYPHLRIAANPGDETLVKLIESLDAGSTADDLAVIFGKGKTEEFLKLNQLMTPAVKARIRARGASRQFLLWELDRNGQLLLGDPGAAALPLDSLMGLAMGFYQTAAILEQGLSTEEEQHQILNAWATSLPIIGDVAMGIISAGDFYYGAGTDKAFQSAAWLAIGLAGFVPPAQLPALAAGLGMMGYEAGSAYFSVKEDKQLIEAWIASGEWDGQAGRLQALLDSAGVRHAPAAADILRSGDAGYKSGLAGTTIRESLCRFAERNGLDKLEKLQSYLRALAALYPSFAFMEALRLPLAEGQERFAAEVRAAGGNPDKSLEMVLFVDAKRIYDAETVRAVQGLVGMVEAEYQARHVVGEAKDAFAELKALGQRLNLPLYENVNKIFDNFSAFISESLKSAFVRESIPRRRVQLAQKYLESYLQVERAIATIRGVFAQAGVHAPGFNLSGFEEVDAPRVRDLEAAYVNRGLGETARDVQAIHRQVAGDAAYRFNANPPHPCDAELHRRLAGIMVRIVATEDLKLLLEQWNGKKAAAGTSRDESLRRAQRAAEAGKGLAQEDIDPIFAGFEADYSWENSQLPANTYEEAVAMQKDRIDKLAREYELAKADGRKQMEACLAQSPAGEILLSNANPRPGEALTAKVVVKKGPLPGNGRWQWQAGAGIQLNASAGEQIGLTARQSGTLTASWNVGGKFSFALRAEIRVQEEKPRQAGQLTARPEAAAPEEPPAPLPPSAECLVLKGVSDRKDEHTHDASVVEGSSRVTIAGNTVATSAQFRERDGAGRESIVEKRSGATFPELPQAIVKGQEIDVLLKVTGAQPPLAKEGLLSWSNRISLEIGLKERAAAASAGATAYKTLGKDLFSAVVMGKAKVVVTYSGVGGSAQRTYTYELSRNPPPAAKPAGLQAKAPEVRVSLSGGSPQVRLGETRAFAAEVVTGDARTKEIFDFQWQPHPEVAFSPFAGSPATKALFKTIGRTMVWVQLLANRDGRKAVVAESEPVEIEVAPPQFSLTAQPAEPFVGQEVRLTVKADTASGTPLWNYWWEISGKGLDAGPIDGNRAYAYVASDPSPVTVTVHGKAAEDGADLGQASLSVQARLYAVSVNEAVRIGPVPRVWSEKDKGLVEAPSAIAINQDFLVSADVSPQPVGALRYSWSADPAGCTILSPSSRETRCSANQAGRYTLAVQVSDSRGIVLGAGRVEVEVIAEGGKSPASESGKSSPQDAVLEATQHLDRALELGKGWKIDEAAAEVAAAKAACPAHPKIAEFERWIAELRQERDAEMREQAAVQAATEHLNRALELGKAGKVDEAAAEVAAAKAAYPAHDKIPEFERWIGELGQQREAAMREQAAVQAATEHLNRALELGKAGRIDEAAAEVAAARAAYPAHDKIPEFERWIGQLRQQREAAMRQQAAVQAATERLNRALELGKAGRIDEAAAEVAAAKAACPSHPKIAEFEQWIAKLMQQRQTASQQQMGAATGTTQAPPLAGTSWNGEASLANANASIVLPFTMAIDGWNRVSGQIVLEAEGESRSMALQGSYDPQTGAFAAEFGHDGSDGSWRGRLVGTFRSPSSAEGQAAVTVTYPGLGSTTLHGTWRASRR